MIHFKRDQFDFFDLDRLRLDEEWNRQSSLYLKWSLDLADARAEHERAKARLDLIEAELDRDIRRSPGDFGVEKVTEGVVSKTILLQKKYQKANQEVIEARYEAEQTGAVVSALEHRKKALESRVQLEVMGYTAEPKVRGDAEARRKSADFDRRAVFEAPGRHNDDD